MAANSWLSTHIINHFTIISHWSYGSGRTALLNLIDYQPDINKIYLYAKDPFKGKYQLLMIKREDAGIKHFYDYKAFIEYWMIWMTFIKIF